MVDDYLGKSATSTKTSVSYSLEFSDSLGGVDVFYTRNRTCNVVKMRSSLTFWGGDAGGNSQVGGANYQWNVYVRLSF